LNFPACASVLVSASLIVASGVDIDRFAANRYLVEASWNTALFVREGERL
jgi:hypothetical protein